MSQIENIALIEKILNSGNEVSEVNTQQEDTLKITPQQERALNNILYNNRSKYTESSEYSKLYDNGYCELDVDLIDKGNIVVRVMDKHNFYETEMMSEEYLNDAPVGLLTKLWIHISKAVKE